MIEFSAYPGSPATRHRKSLSLVISACLMLILGDPDMVRADAVAPPIRIGASHFPPYFIGNQTRNGEYHLDQATPSSGFILDSIEAIFASEGKTVLFSFLPLARAENFVRAKKLNCFSPVRKKARSNERFLYSDPMPGSPLILLGRTGETDKIARLADLKKYRVGTMVGDYSSLSRLNSANIKHETARTNLLNLQKLVLKRVDYIVIDHAVALKLITDVLPGYADKVEPVYPPLAYHSIHLACNAKDPSSREIIASFNRGLKNMLKTGDLFTIAEKYGLDDLSTESQGIEILK